MHRLPRDCYKIWGSQWPPMLPALWNTQVSIKKRLLCHYNYEIWTKTVFFFGKYRTRLVCQCIACLGFSGKIMSVFWTIVSPNVLALQLIKNNIFSIFFIWHSSDFWMVTFSTFPILFYVPRIKYKRIHNTLHQRSKQDSPKWWFRGRLEVVGI